MNVDDVLNDDTFLLYCAQHYDNVNCHTTQEFLEDLKRLKYIKKLLTRFQQGSVLKERLILNHIIILSNVFGPAVTSKLLFFKLKMYLPQVKPFLIYLNILPDRLYNVGDCDVVWTDDIPMDQRIIDLLRSL